MVAFLHYTREDTQGKNLLPRILVVQFRLGVYFFLLHNRSLDCCFRPQKPSFISIFSFKFTIYFSLFIQSELGCRWNQINWYYTRSVDFLPWIHFDNFPVEIAKCAAVPYPPQRHLQFLLHCTISFAVFGMFFFGRTSQGRVRCFTGDGDYFVFYFYIFIVADYYFGPFQLWLVVFLFKDV